MTDNIELPPQAAFISDAPDASEIADYARAAILADRARQAPTPVGIDMQLIQHWRERAEKAEAALARQAPARSITAEALSRMFEPVDGLDKKAEGYHWRKGWNAALRRAQDYCQAPAPVEVSRLVRELLACSMADPARKYPDDHPAKGRKTTINAPTELVEQLRAAIANSPAPSEASEPPAGWVPLRIGYGEDEDPEDVAFGPPLMMARLEKWLKRYFELIATEVPPAPTPVGEVPAGWREALTRARQFIATSGDGTMAMKDEIEAELAVIDAMLAAYPAPAASKTDNGDRHG